MWPCSSCGSISVKKGDLSNKGIKRTSGSRLHWALRHHYQPITSWVSLETPGGIALISFLKYTVYGPNYSDASILFRATGVLVCKTGLAQLKPAKLLDARDQTSHLSIGLR